METKRIKIYSDKKYLTQEEYEPILFPFWGLSPAEKNNPFGGQFDTYIKNGRNYFEMTTIEDCDFVVLPEKYNKNNREKMQPLIDIAGKYNKPILIFFFDDSAEKIDIENSYTFRTSLYGKIRRPNEFAMPSWTEDFTAKYFNNKLPIRKKQEKPTVSYCGYTKTWKDKIKDVLGIDYGSWRPLRYKVIKILNSNENIYKKFIIRSDFWGGVYSTEKNASELDLNTVRLKIRKEYVNNLLEGDYAFVTRGQGNYSMRFCEVLSLGRIPLFINTDCVLPYEKHINWKYLCVWIEDDDLEKIPDKLLEFHENISTENFEKIQNEIRQIYEEWISPDGFFKNFYLHFLKDER